MKKARRLVKRPATQLGHDALATGAKGVQRALAGVSQEPEWRPSGTAGHRLDRLPMGSQQTVGDVVLEQARLHWQLGDWDALVQLDDQRLPECADRARLALLVATAYQHLGRLADAHRLGRAALQWGCSKPLVARVLLAGVHNGLALAAAAAGDHQTSTQHFDAASALAGSTQPTAIHGARAVRELARIGLVPEAVRLLQRQVEAVSRPSPPTDMTADRLTTLAAELELLRGELSLAQQRGQVSNAQRPDSTARQSDDDWQRALETKATSQLGQDLWVLALTSYKRGGYFVEFGATDGVLLSNSYLLETEFGWNGICAEPNPKLFGQLQKNRRCVLSDACIGSHSGVEVEFIFADAYGGIADYAQDDSHAAKREAYRRQGAVARLTTESLHDFLNRHQAPRHIDYLSIDTEGSEFDILNAFPFEQWRIALLTVEHNFTPRRADIRALLESKGYRCTEQQWDDWYQLQTP